MPTKAEKVRRGAEVNRILAGEYPDARCALGFKSPYELLVATILSAQCTDARVNMVTPDFFRIYPDPRALAAAETVEIEEIVRSTGFYRNKAKSLKGMAEAVVARHKGRIPETMEDLVELPGVGRKTANVVLGNCFNTPGITVDTHCQRVSVRIGIAADGPPEKIEADLMAVIPPKDWTEFSHRIISHGRQVCNARKPHCEACVLASHCDYFASFQRKTTKSRTGKGKA
jgi:endonuclease III